MNLQYRGVPYTYRSFQVKSISTNYKLQFLGASVDHAAANLNETITDNYGLSYRGVVMQQQRQFLGKVYHTPVTEFVPVG